MFRGETETEKRRDERGDERGRLLGRGGSVRRGVAFASAFAAGFLLGRRRASKMPEEEEMTPDEGPAQVGETEPESETGPAGETEPAGGPEIQWGAETQSAGVGTVEIDSEIAALSAPTAHGMPMLGLGTYRIDDHAECVDVVDVALQIGYRHIDTAESFGNETAIGDALSESDVDREDLFVATKISPDNLDYDHVLTNAEESLSRLGFDYVDLLYVQWPTGEYEPLDTMEAFAELREEGMIANIGVSNFTVELLEEAIDVAEEPIFANQVEMHPLLPQTKLQQFCAQDDVDVELVAHTPLARGKVEEVPEVRQVADEYDATPEQVSLAWLREKGATAIPKADNWNHLRENWSSLSVELDDEDVDTIDSIDRRERLVDPDEAPWNQ